MYPGVGPFKLISPVGTNEFVTSGLIGPTLVGRGELAELVRRSLDAVKCETPNLVAG